jgi:DNA-binding CsgD family transcriptional regulator
VARGDLPSGAVPSGAVQAFVDEVADLILRGDPRMALLGPRESAIEHLARFAASPQRRVWNMQHTLSVHHLREYGRLDASSRASGADLRLVVPLEALRRSPLHVCLEEPVRVAPVPAPMLVVDDAVILAGPSGTEVQGSLWVSEDPELVDRAAAAHRRVWETSVPGTQALGMTVLPSRTREVALRLLDGASDREIAAELGVSERTVSAEVRRIVTWVGARSRGHAIAKLVGAG